MAKGNWRRPIQHSIAASKRGLKQFEVTFKNLTKSKKFDSELGFGMNPPGPYFSKNKWDARRELKKIGKKIGIKPIRIKEVKW